MADVAVLITRSFPRGVDQSGRRLLAQMRSLGRAGALGWLIAPLFIPSGAYSEGFVWEEDGAIVGNASLHEVEGAPGRFVLANVAVDPACRRRGIGRALVQASLDFARQRGASEVLLQVEADNEAAIRLYTGLGFRVLTTRTLWTLRPGPSYSVADAARDTRPAFPDEWKDQWTLAQRLHPEGLVWPYPLSAQFFRRKGKLGSLVLGGLQHWGWPAEGPRAWITARRSLDYGAWRLILMVESEARGGAEAPLLRRALSELSGRARSIALDYPAGAAVTELGLLGFTAERTLTWMAREWPGVRARVDAGRAGE
jgi:GNAT superfamily N-acetyltransferase